MLNQNINDSIGNDIARLRLTAGLKQSAIAESLKIDASRVSRIETGEVIPELEEVQQLAKAIGSPEAMDYARYAAEHWNVIPKPPFWHPSRLALRKAEQTLTELANFLEKHNPDGYAKAQFEMHRESLLKSTSYLESLFHSIAFVGDIGVGKSTAICAGSDLLVEPDKTAKKTAPKAVLETGGGGTTLCEVHIHSETVDVYGLIVQPNSETEVFRLVNDFCAALVDRHNGLTEGVRGVSQEVNRAIRNMAGLVRPQGKGETKTSPPDPAMELVKQCEGNLPEVAAEVLARIKLGLRTQCEFRFQESDRQAGLKKLQQIFAEVNRGQRADVSLPRRIDLIVPFPLLGKRSHQLRIVDTKGVDGTAIRPDIRAHLDDSRTLTVLCSRYNDAPCTTMQGLLEHLVNTGAENIISERVAMLVLPRQNEALAMKDDSGMNADTIEEGYRLKREQAGSKMAQFKDGDKVPILFFNSMDDDRSGLSKSLIEGVQKMRNGQVERISQVYSAVRELIKSLGETKSKAAHTEVIRRLKQFVNKQCKLPERTQKPHQRLIEALQLLHPRTVWATTRRNGTWSGLDVYHFLGVGTATDAQARSQTIFSGLDGVLADMSNDEQLAPAVEFVSELRKNVSSWRETFLSEATTVGRELFRARLFEHEHLWTTCADFWGDGPGFRNAVANELRLWCEDSKQADLLETVEKRVITLWDEAFVEPLRKLCA